MTSQIIELYNYMTSQIIELYNYMTSQIIELYNYMTLQIIELYNYMTSQIIELYNYLTSAEGRSILISEWRRDGILDAVAKGRRERVPLDPFHDIDPLLDISIFVESTEVTEDIFVSSYTNMSDVEVGDDSESEE